MSSPNFVHFHESAHAVVGASQGLKILRIEAPSTDPRYYGLVRHSEGGDAGALLLMNLAGPIAQHKFVGAPIAVGDLFLGDSTDAGNARQYLAELIQKDPDCVRCVVPKFVALATALVSCHWANIAIVADILAAKKILEGPDLDRLLPYAPTEPETTTFTPEASALATKTIVDFYKQSRNAPTEDESWDWIDPRFAKPARQGLRRFFYRHDLLSRRKVKAGYPVGAMFK